MREPPVRRRVRPGDVYAVKPHRQLLSLIPALHNYHQVYLVWACRIRRGRGHRGPRKIQKFQMNSRMIRWTQLCSDQRDRVKLYMKIIGTRVAPEYEDSVECT